MTVLESASAALVWITRAVRVLPAFEALWHAIASEDHNQVLAAQLELTRQIRTEQARAEIERGAG